MLQSPPTLKENDMAKKPTRARLVWYDWSVAMVILTLTLPTLSWTDAIKGNSDDQVVAVLLASVGILFLGNFFGAFLIRRDLDQGNLSLRRRLIIFLYPTAMILVEILAMVEGWQNIFGLFFFLTIISMVTWIIFMMRKPPEA